MLNSKHEIRNSKQIRMTEIPRQRRVRLRQKMTETEVLKIRISNLFRISIFEFRI